mmetsp:Transcript_14797/g.28162  ORF Transcript_14797/g.28162 Transcript_14797/m.28162 type:complete len:223 (-) Transcript_14797:82-750(-)|eukprot:scaffold3648_cov149-Amphora_coffeaeformis.AAC.1
MSDSKRELPATTSNSDDTAPAAKRPREEENDKEILDLAKTLGFRDGDRLEVAWRVNDEEDVHWWGATLLPWSEGDIVDDCVAVRQLKYDPHPDAGFDEESIEPVVFLDVDTLAHPETQEQLEFRREGETEESGDEGSPIRADPSELVEQTLKNALAKYGGFLSQLPASQQALIAAKMAEKREHLIDHLKVATQTGVVTKDRMQDILTRVSRGEEAETTSSTK